MNPHLLDAIEEIVKADRNTSEKMVRGAEAMIRAMRQQRATFDSKHEHVKKEIKRGGSLTKHRIPL